MKAKVHKLGGCTACGEISGADRERRRIRRALRGAMAIIRLEHSQQPEEALDAMSRGIDAATKPRKR